MSFGGAFLGAQRTQQTSINVSTSNEALSPNNISESKAEETPDSAIEDNTTIDENSDPKTLPASFVCCITSELLVDPVVASDGHSYENSAITRWFERHDTSPKTGERLQSKALIPNHNLRSQVIEYRLAEGLPELPPWQPPSSHLPQAEDVTSSTSRLDSISTQNGRTNRVQRININIPREELTLITRDISSIFDQSPELIDQLNLIHLSPTQREQAVIRNPAALHRLAIHSRAQNMEEASARFLALHTHLNRIFQETARSQAAHQQNVSPSNNSPNSPPQVTPGESLPSPVNISGNGSGGGVGRTQDEPPLFRAARAGDSSGLLRELRNVQITAPQLFAMGSGQPIDRPRNTKGESLLMIAASTGQIELLRALCNESFTSNEILPIRSGPADPCLVSPRDQATALHSAAVMNQVESIRTLVDIISATSSIESVETAIHAKMLGGETPLHLAAMSGSMDALKFLIDVTNARVDTLRSDGCSALHAAASQGHKESVKALLQRDASPTLADFTKQLTPIHFAARQGHDEVLRLLLNIPEEDVGDSGDATAETSGILSPNIGGKHNIQPLHLAAMWGHDHTCTLLLDYGANVNVRTTDNHTPLSMACHHLKSTVVTLLLARGADVNQMGGENEPGRGPFSRVLFSKHAEISLALIHAGIDLSLKTPNESSTLHLASWSGLLEVCSLILHKHPDMIHAVTDDGDTPLLQAAYNGHIEVCELLLNRGAAVNASKRDGNTALHLCAKRGMTAVARLLLRRGADASLKNALRLEPIALARTGNHFNVVTAIMEASTPVS